MGDFPLARRSRPRYSALVTIELTSPRRSLPPLSTIGIASATVVSNPAHTSHTAASANHPKMPSSSSGAAAAAGDGAGLRACELNDAPANAGFVSNIITTGKYTLLSFVPVSLFAQCVGVGAL